MGNFSGLYSVISDIKAMTAKLCKMVCKMKAKLSKEKVGSSVLVK
jgi:hypothetical protein